MRTPKETDHLFELAYIVQNQPCPEADLIWHGTERGTIALNECLGKGYIHRDGESLRATPLGLARYREVQESEFGADPVAIP